MSATIIPFPGRDYVERLEAERDAARGAIVTRIEQLLSELNADCRGLRARVAWEDVE